MTSYRNYWFAMGLGVMAVICPMAQTNTQSTDQIVRNGLQLNGLHLNGEASNKHPLDWKANVQPDWVDPAKVEVKLVDQSVANILLEGGKLSFQTAD